MATENPTEQTEPTQEQPIEETPITEDETAPEVVNDLTINPENGDGIIPEQPVDLTASEIVDLQSADAPDQITPDTENKTTHTISAADLNSHPELSKQGVSLNDEVAHDSLWIYQYPSADRSNIVQEKWPRDVSGFKR